MFDDYENMKWLILSIHSQCYDLDYIQIEARENRARTKEYSGYQDSAA